MYVFILFLTTSCISFLGSVQAGPLNLYVLNTAIHQNRKNALFVAIGGVIPEFIYAFLAIITFNNLIQQTGFLYWMKVIFILILIILAIICFTKKAEKEATEIHVHNKTSPIKSILKGLLLAGFNPQLLPFWIAILLAFQGFSFLEVKSSVQQFAFCFGATSGALALQLSLIMLTKRFGITLNKIVSHRFFYKLLSLLFLILAFQQIIKM